MKFKRGLLLFLAVAAFFLTISYASAAFLSIQSLVESEWVNAALLFLLVFNFVLMIMRDVFRGGYGAAIIISIVIALGSSLGLVYYFGAFLSKVGIWLLVIFVVAIALLIFRLGRRSRAGGIIFLVLGAASIVWLTFLHKQVCPPLGGLFQNICQVFDVLAIILLIICFIKLVSWLIGLSRKGRGGGGAGRAGRPRRPGREGEHNERIGNLTGFVRDSRTNVGISGASVEVHGGIAGQSAMTDGSGHYTLQLHGRRNIRGRIYLRRPNYNVTANASGYDSETHQVIVLAERATHQDFNLRSTGQHQPNQPNQPGQPGGHRIDLIVQGQGYVTLGMIRFNQGSHIIAPQQHARGVLVAHDGQEEFKHWRVLTYTRTNRALGFDFNKSFFQRNLIIRAVFGEEAREEKQEERHERSARELEHAYNDYKFKIFNRGITPLRRRQILQAMKIIYQKALQQHKILKPTPQQIEQKLNASSLLSDSREKQEERKVPHPQWAGGEQHEAQLKQELNEREQYKSRVQNSMKEEKEEIKKLTGKKRNLERTMRDLVNKRLTNTPEYRTVFSNIRLVGEEIKKCKRKIEEDQKLIHHVDSQTNDIRNKIAHHKGF